MPVWLLFSLLGGEAHDPARGSGRACGSGSARAEPYQGEDEDGREWRSNAYGPFKIAEVYRKVDGIKTLVAWGAVCGCHTDTDAVRAVPCKKQVMITGRVPYAAA